MTHAHHLLSPAMRHLEVVVRAPVAAAAATIAVAVATAAALVEEIIVAVLPRDARGR